MQILLLSFQNILTLYTKEDKSTILSLLPPQSPWSMSDAAVSVLVLGMSLLDLETYGITKSSYLPHNMENTRVEHGLDEPSYSERGIMEDTHWSWNLTRQKLLLAEGMGYSLNRPWFYSLGPWSHQALLRELHAYLLVQAFKLFSWNDLLRYLNLPRCFDKVMATFLNRSLPWSFNSLFG